MECSSELSLIHVKKQISEIVGCINKIIKDTDEEILKNTNSQYKMSYSQ